MKTLFADSNIFLRFLLGDIHSQAEQSKKYLQNAKNGKIRLIICQIVVFEIIFVLEKLYGFSKKQTIETVRTIVSMPYLEIEDKAIFLVALELYRKTNMDLVDIFLFCKAKNSKAEILTFDKDFQKLK